jgi:hypothetical protein
MWHYAHDFHRENEKIGGISNSSTLSPPITSPFPIPPLTSQHLSHSHSNLPYTSPPPPYHTSLIPLPPLPFPCYRNLVPASAPPNRFLPHGHHSLVGPCEFSPSTSLHITPVHTLSNCHLQSSHWSQSKTSHGLEASGWTRRSHLHRLRTVMGVRPNPNPNEDSY